MEVARFLIGFAKARSCCVRVRLHARVRVCILHARFFAFKSVSRSPCMYVNAFDIYMYIYIYIYIFLLGDLRVPCLS